MKKFKVIVHRSEYRSTAVEIEAEGKSEAIEKALDEAGDYEFNDGDVIYEAGSCEEI